MVVKLGLGVGERVIVCVDDGEDGCFSLRMEGWFTGVSHKDGCVWVCVGLLLRLYCF